MIILLLCSIRSTIVYTEKSKMNFKINVALITSIIFFSVSSGAFAKRVSCKSFKTQSEAQAYFIKHKAKSLDRDGDGRWQSLRLLTWW